METREMNFFDLCKAIVQAVIGLFVRLGVLIAAMLRITCRIWWIVLSLTAIGIAAGLYYSRPSNRIYPVNATVVLNGPTADAVKECFEGLSNVPIGMKSQSLQQRLGLTEEEAADVSNFCTFYAIDCLHDGTVDYIDYKGSVSPSDTVNTRATNILALQFRTKHLDNIPHIEACLTDYLNRQPQFCAAFERNRSEQVRQARFDDEQIEKLDSMITAFYQGAAMPQLQFDRWNTNMVIGKHEIQLFLDDVEEFFEHKIARSKLFVYCTAPIVLRDHFIASGAPINGRVKCTAIGLLLGWILGCIIACLIERRKDIARWLKK